MDEGYGFIHDKLDIKLLMRTATVLFKRDSTQGFTVSPGGKQPPAEIQSPRRRRRTENQ